MYAPVRRRRPQSRARLAARNVREKTDILHAEASSVQVMSMCARVAVSRADERNLSSHVAVRKADERNISSRVAANNVHARQ